MYIRSFSFLSEKMKATLLQIIMLKYIVDFCGYGTYSFSRSLLTTQHVSQNNHNFAEDNVRLMQSTIQKARCFSSVKVINADMIYPTKRNILTCHANSDQTKILSIVDEYAHGYSDNDVSNDDLVKQQYIQLPYPTIRHDTIEMEYKYYLGQNSKYPVSSQYSMKLEYLNHYLYQGQNNFEYVLSLYQYYTYV